ncbi:hypothetical protein GCM10007424_04230 [Flavobacterium suaedae]|uniref:DUF1206 domain-containing protein n=2 Tax=Flavobacterium suaedae TaxID=1767027 RepID=A0ABQ1JJ91_9FLAO|nr:hypothetical protein GCM10007424_04230 [Flavobacterium suaedae]
MAAFNINGQSTKETGKGGVFDFLYQQTGGQIMLGILALGLVCYCIWRFVEAFSKKDTDKKSKKYIKTFRYIFSAVAYGVLAYRVIKKLISGISSSSSDSGGNSTQQNVAQELLSKPFGQILVGIAAAILLGVGIYQIYYGYSEKYKKHVDKTVEKGRKIMLNSGKMGYIARGVVWLLLAWLFAKAAIDANASKAGDTAKAFSYLKDVEYGPYLLAAVGFGLICYGVFSFVRARYEKFA